MSYSEHGCVVSSKMSCNAVVFLNNLAVRYLQQANHECSLQTLAVASNEFCLLHSESISSCDNSIRSKRSPVMRWVKVGQRERQNDILEAHSMYGHAPMLLEVEEESLPERLWLYATKAVLLFNLACVHHWRAVHAGMASALAKALTLYEEAATTIQQLFQKGGMLELEQLALAILNNLGHVHYELLQFDQAQEYYDLLRLRISHGVGSLSLLYGMEDHATFVLSAMLPITRPTYAQPA